MYYVQDGDATALCYVVDKRNGERLGEMFPMGQEPTIDEETQAIVGAPTWDNLTSNHGGAVEYAAWEMNQATLSLVFLGLVKRPSPENTAAPYQKVKLSFQEQTDKQMVNALKVTCEGCDREEKGGKRGVTVNVYRAGVYCMDCAEVLELGKPSTVTRYTREGYVKHASEKGNQAFLFADGVTYNYNIIGSDRARHGYGSGWEVRLNEGARRYEMIPISQVDAEAA